MIYPITILRQRRAIRLSGHCATNGISLNHSITIKRWIHSHRTPFGLIPQPPSEYRGFYIANLEAQGEVA